MVPLRRIHLSKRILSTTQDEHKVVITCADNTSYEGSILIGADGAYSSVRQNMYKELTKMGSLPKNDAKPLGYSFDCLVGVTSPLDPSLYPVCDEKYSEFQIILGTDVPNTVSRKVQVSIPPVYPLSTEILLVSSSKHAS